MMTAPWRRVQDDQMDVCTFDVYTMTVRIADGNALVFSNTPDAHTEPIAVRDPDTGRFCTPDEQRPHALDALFRRVYDTWRTFTAAEQQRANTTYEATIISDGHELGVFVFEGTIYLSLVDLQTRNKMVLTLHDAVTRWLSTSLTDALEQV